MNNSFKIIFDYPGWFILLCLLLGAGYSAILYYKEKNFDEAPKYLKNILAFSRAIVVSVIAFFLLSPLVSHINRRLEKPVIVIAQDNSQSVVLNKDSSFYKGDYLKQLKGLAESLGDDYQVSPFVFGDNVKEGQEVNYDQKLTNLQQVFEEIDNRFSNRNVGAVIIASDGIVNQGVDPANSINKIKFPVYSIALGDTTVQKDLMIYKVNHNRLAYLGNNFPVEVVLKANKLAGQNTVLTITNNGAIIFTKNILISTNKLSLTIPAQLLAKKSGLQKYSVQVTSLKGELTYNNNAFDFYVDVIDGKQKILLLAAAPHPDINAIKQAIEQNENYEIEFFLADKFNKSLKEYNLVVVHQIPANTGTGNTILKEIERQQLSVLIIIGGQSNVNAFNEQNTGLKITNSKSSTNEAQAVYDPSFSLFNLSEATLNNLPKFPPLIVPYGNYQNTNSCNTLFKQKVLSVETGNPLIAFCENNGVKSGVICGEGLWRWKLADYLNNGNYNVFNEIINKSIQYLAVKVDKSFFRVSTKEKYLENEPVVFDAELYNQSYELTNEPEIAITITSNGKTFPFTFSKTDNTYRLNAGILPVGEYTYTSTVKFGNKTLMVKGEFSIAAIQLEQSNTTANHQLLYSIAKQSGGAMFYPAQLKELAEAIKKREDIKTVSYNEKQLNELINIKWIFFLLVALISLEWFARKYFGRY